MGIVPFEDLEEPNEGLHPYSAFLYSSSRATEAELDWGP